jgi:hypothetical protein
MRTCSIVVVSLLAHTAAADPCIASGSNPVMMAIGGGKLSYCFELDDAKLNCFATEIATATTAAAPSPAPLGQQWPRRAPTPRKVMLKNTDGGKKPKLCRADGTKCKTLAMSHAIDQGMGLVAAQNAALTVAALSSLEWIDTFDLRSGKRIATFKTGPKNSSCNALEFAGDTLVIGEETCGEDGMTAWLATTKGKKVADVGGEMPITLGFQSIAKLTGNNFAFTTLAGEAVIVQDVKTGKVSKRLPVVSAVPKQTGYLVGDGTSLAVIYGGTRAGDVAIIDLGSDKIRTYSAKRCVK